METKIIEFSTGTGWEWIVQLISLGFLSVIGAILIAALILLILLIRKLKKKD